MWALNFSDAIWMARIPSDSWWNLIFHPSMLSCKSLFVTICGDAVCAGEAVELSTPVAHSLKMTSSPSLFRGLICGQSGLRYLLQSRLLCHPYMSSNSGGRICLVIFVRSWVLLHYWTQEQIWRTSYCRLMLRRWPWATGWLSYLHRWRKMLTWPRCWRNAVPCRRS